jgi:hypothetical protein
MPEKGFFGAFLTILRLLAASDSGPGGFFNVYVKNLMHTAKI